MTRPTLGVRYVRHVRHVRWWRSELPNRIPRRHTMTRATAHLVTGTMKIAGYAVAGLAVAITEGVRRAAPPLHRHVRRTVRRTVHHRKWVPYRHPVTQSQPLGRFRRYAVACDCGEVFTSPGALTNHHRAGHTTTPVVVTTTPAPIRVRTTGPTATPPTRPATGAPLRSPGRHHARLLQRGAALMSTNDSLPHALNRAWADIGDHLPTGIQDILDLAAALAVATSATADHIARLHETLISRLNIDPTALVALHGVRQLHDDLAGTWTAVVAGITDTYAPVLDLARQGISIPTEEALRS